MAGPDDMVIPMLREMRAENKALHDPSAERLVLIERRLKKTEDAQVSFRQAPTGVSPMGKLIAGEFEERIEPRERRASAVENLEKRIKELEARK